ncbi:MAG: hypothetical protein ACXWX9_08695 [Actinomycetota bacterium]
MVEVVEHVEQKRVVGSIEAAGDVTLERSLVGAVSAHSVRLNRAVGGPMLTSGDVTITHGGCGPVMCSGDVSITYGGCGPVLARGDVTILNGGTQSVIAGEAHVGSGAFVGMVLGPKVNVEDGARILMSTTQAAAFGATLGALLGLVAFRRRR